MSLKSLFGTFGVDNRDDERFIIIVHRHWWVLFRKVVGVTILFITPLVVVPVVGASLPASANAAEMGALFGFLGSAWLLVCWHLLFARWTDYYLDFWIITNWRIIDVHLHGLYKIEVSTLIDLDHIQDITIRSIGIIPNLLNFGDLELQTAGAKTEFLIREAPNPQRIERLVRMGQEELSKIKSAHQIPNNSPL